MSSAARNGAPDLDKSTIDYEAIQDPGEGHSVAGWTGAILVFLGAITATFGNVVGNWTIFWVGVAIAASAIIIAPILFKAGFGAKPHHNTLKK